MCVCVCACVRGQLSGVLSCLPGSGCPPCRQSLLNLLSCCFSCPARFCKFPGFCLLTCSSNAELQICVSIQLFMWVWGIELRPSDFHGKYFYQLNHLLSFEVFNLRLSSICNKSARFKHCLFLWMKADFCPYHVNRSI